MRLFEDAGLTPRVVQVADEKQTIVNIWSQPDWSRAVDLRRADLVGAASKRRPQPDLLDWSRCAMTGLSASISAVVQHERVGEHGRPGGGAVELERVLLVLVHTCRQDHALLR